MEQPVARHFSGQREMSAQSYDGPSNPTKIANAGNRKEHVEVREEPRDWASHTAPLAIATRRQSSLLCTVAGRSAIVTRCWWHEAFF